MLENCSKEFFYYPLRALLEFYSDKAHERSLGKRLNAESLLAYKVKKVTMGRVLQLTDFKKNLISDARARTTKDPYTQIYQDTITMISRTISQFQTNQNNN